MKKETFSALLVTMRELLYLKMLCGGRGKEILLHKHHNHLQLTKKELLLYIVFLIYFKLICIICIYLY